MGTGTPFSPYTESDFYDRLIRKKREIIAADGLRWTSESPDDLGVAMLRMNAHEGGLLAEYAAERTKQNFIIYAIDDMAVHATSRALGYRIKGAVPAKFKTKVTTNAAQVIPIGSVLTKETSDGNILKFELLEELIFTVAGSKYAYVLQGETHTTSQTADGTEFQEVIVTNFPIAHGSGVVIVAGTIWNVVSDFIDSNSESKHFVVEYDYTGQPTVIFGDGEYGKVPESGDLITVAWRTCEGKVGNLAPGEMQFETNYAAVTEVTNEAPSKGVLAADVVAGASTVTLNDVGDMSGFLSSGLAYIEEDSFSYTGITGTDFTGCSGLELPHLSGEEVTYSLTYTYGANRETNKEAKVSAIRFNRTKGSAKSLLDYRYFAEQVPGVARARATNSNNVITIQIIPADAGIPSASLLNTIYTELALRKGALHTVSVINPIYVYIDVTIMVSAAAGQSYLNTVKAATLTEVQKFLNPLTKDEGNLYYLNGWGNLLKKNLLEARVFYMSGGVLVADAEVTVFKRSNVETGDSNIQLANNEVAHIGRITVGNKDVPFGELLPGEKSGAQSVNTLPKVAVEIL